MQRAFRKQNGYNTSIRQEFTEAARQLKAAGLSPKKIKRALNQNYKYFKELGQFKMNRYELETLYTLNDPTTSQAIKMLPLEWHISYSSYIQFLELSNGLFGDEITLLEAEDIQQRNIDYEVQEYLPNFLMIGDNGGGIAILMDNKEQNIFAVGMGVMIEDSLEKISSSLEEFLLVKKGMFNY